METPNELRRAEDEKTLVRRYEYDEETVIMVDFGEIDDISVDIVGETAIVVGGDRQVEFELPAEADGVTVNNGTVTIEE
ncbi:MAG: hypothetical protein IH933_10865 [Euryarchaeota archaeon]|nr:hypothetical protein [Euryarchaeota archaeon]